jgi:hypothetical protein
MQSRHETRPMLVRVLLLMCAFIIFLQCRPQLRQPLTFTLPTHSVAGMERCPDLS